MSAIKKATSKLQTLIVTWCSARAQTAFLSSKKELVQMEIHFDRKSHFVWLELIINGTIKSCSAFHLHLNYFASINDGFFFIMTLESLSAE